MTETAKALYQFLGGFGLPAYVENAVPEDAELPYITYQLIQPGWRDEMTQLYARIWYRSTSYQEVSAKADEIRAAVGEMASVQTDSGAVYLAPGTPYVQNMPMDDKSIKAVYMLFTVIAEI